ncbi:hypothetical protein OIJ90_004732, partial [Salmonella enterica]|nr:hypothetical protein [Salmonella enterica]
MAKGEEEKYRMMVTLTKEEYEILSRVAELDGKPMATLFMQFVREAKVFVVFKKVIKASETLIAAKSYFSRN